MQKYRFVNFLIIPTGTWGMDFVSSSPFSLPPPTFSKFSYQSFLFQNFDFSSNHSIISISQFEFLSEKFFVCVNSYLPWNYFNVSIFRWSLCHFYEIIVYCYVFSAIYIFRQKIREQYSEHIWVFHCNYSIRKKTGLSFLHFV